MIVSLMVGLPDWTMNTSLSRTLVRMRTLVSPLARCQPVSHSGIGSVCLLWEEKKGEGGEAKHEDDEDDEGMGSRGRQSRQRA